MDNTGPQGNEESDMTEQKTLTYQNEFVKMDFWGSQMEKCDMNWPEDLKSQFELLKVGIRKEKMVTS